MADALLGYLVINEIHAQPVISPGVGYDTDGNGAVNPRDEYIEFLNTGSTSLDISGVQLWDPGVGSWFTFPVGSVLAPGGYAIVVTGLQPGGGLPSVGAGSLAFNAGRSSALMNNPGDAVFLHDPASNTFIAAAYGTTPLFDPTDPTTWPGPPFSTAGLSGPPAFPVTATQIGSGEHFGAVNPGDSIQRAPDGGGIFVNNLGETPGAQNVCFVAGTCITTENGDVCVEGLRVGDMVLTMDHGYQPIRWIGASPVSVAKQLEYPGLRPICFLKGALGRNLPNQVLFVSRQHCMMVSSVLAERSGGSREVLVPANKMLVLESCQVDPKVRNITYFHLLFDEHEIIFANGAPTESLYLGSEAGKALSTAARNEVILLFPDFADVFSRRYPTARIVVDHGNARRLLSAIAEAKNMVLDGFHSKRDTPEVRY